VLAAAARSRHPLITVGSAGRRLSTAQAGQLTGLLAQLVTQKLTPVVVTNAPLNADLRRIVDAGNVALVRQRQTGIADREWMFRLPKADDEESLGPMLTPDALVAAAARAPRDLAASMDLRLGEWLTMQPALRPEFFARNEAALVSSMESLSGLAGAIDDLPGRVATLPKAGQPEVESLEAAGLAEGSLTALRLARRTELAGEVMAVLGAPDSTTRITTALRLVGQVPPDDLVSLAAGHGQVQAVVRAAAKLHDMKSTDPAGAAKAAAQSITALRPWFRADTKAGDVPHVVNALAAEAERLSTEHPADAEYWRTGYSALMAAVLSCE